MMRGLRTYRYLLAVAALATGPVSAVSLAVAAETSPALNNMCPVMTEEEVDPAITATYQGTAVAFCCDNCKKRFLANPDRYLDRLPRIAVALGESKTVPRSDIASAGEQTDAATSVSDRHPDDDDGRHAHVPVESAVAQASWFGRIHPAIVHFPVAGTPLALLGFVAWRWTKNPAFARADVLPLAVATVSSVAAFLTGSIAERSTTFGESLRATVERHEAAGLLTATVIAILLGVRLWRWNAMEGAVQRAYLVGLAVASVLVALTGYLGGSLVFGSGHLTPW